VNLLISSTGGGFDPLNQSAGSTAPALEAKSEGGLASICAVAIVLLWWK